MTFGDYFLQQLVVGLSKAESREDLFDLPKQILMNKRPPVLFVCICRSPTAEAVCRKVARDRATLKSTLPGPLPLTPVSGRTEAAGVRRGYDFSGMTARLVTTAIFPILTTSLRQIRVILLICNSVARLSISINSVCSSPPPGGDAQVVDPYYGGDRGFEAVLDLLELACGQWLSRISGL